MATLAAVTAHVNHRSSCPVPTTPMSDFDASKFLGEWYVIQSFDPDVSCLVFNYTSCGTGCLSVAETKQIDLINRMGVSHVYRTDGTLRVTGSVAAEMEASFTTNARSAIYTVLATDYTEFAAVYTCQNIGLDALPLYHRRDVYVLARNRSISLRPDQVDQISSAMMDNQIEDESALVSHDSCISAKEATLDLNASKLGQTVSSVATTVSEGIGKFASSIAGIFSSGGGGGDDPAAASISPLRRRRGAHF
ncbi:apolipoprotein D-like [Pollicipes pollicipes]|uniref:apolipoprotein D-like n=1 Tax=Pollicipes pollicipes TaxID=41117 RepID=UPI0018857A1F|nr:apolipoprotein D-like [Pollicipes pollicipes]